MEMMKKMGLAMAMLGMVVMMMMGHARGGGDCSNLIGQLSGSCRMYVFQNGRGGSSSLPVPSIRSPCCSLIRANANSLACVCNSMPPSIIRLLAPGAIRNIVSGCGLRIPRGFRCQGYGG